MNHSQLVKGAFFSVYLSIWGAGVAHTQNRQIQYFHGDSLDSASLISNDNGEVIESTCYTPFGEVCNGISAASRDSHFKFTGQQLDPESGLYNYSARYYAPTTSHFMSVDPIRDGLNPYAYVSNNPLRWVDPKGEERVALGGSTFNMAVIPVRPGRDDPYTRFTVEFWSVEFPKMQRPLHFRVSYLPSEEMLNFRTPGVAELSSFFSSSQRDAVISDAMSLIIQEVGKRLPIRAISLAAEARFEVADAARMEAAIQHTGEYIPIGNFRRVEEVVGESRYSLRFSVGRAAGSIIKTMALLVLLHDAYKLAESPNLATAEEIAKDNVPSLGLPNIARHAIADPLAGKVEPPLNIPEPSSWISRLMSGTPFGQLAPQRPEENLEQ